MWRNEFLWSGVSFFVAGTAGAIGAVLIDRGKLGIALLMLAPIYLTYWTYRIFVGRLECQAQHRGRQPLQAIPCLLDELADECGRVECVHGVNPAFVFKQEIRRSGVFWFQRLNLLTS